MAGFVKLGEAIEISAIENTETCLPMVEGEILARFQKFATDLKKIAPKADDFLYFSCILLHSSEASSINDDGTPKLTRDGKPVVVGWDKSGGTWKWVSNDPSVRAYKNSNGDIFPEEELVKAYRKWVGKPLCIDHKSASVDHVRGFIVDTYYDRKLKRVVGLCALDKVSYPDLARKVETGYSNSVSMGTAVGRAICYDCGKTARNEHEFCAHMKTKSGYGEINIDLNPIELSIVVNGADPKATIKQVLAAANHLNAYVEGKEKELQKLAEPFFKATLESSDYASNTPDGGKQTLEIQGNDLEKFKADLDEAVKKLSEIQNSVDFGEKLEETENNGALDQAVSQTSSEPALSPPHERFAEDLEKLKMITRGIEEKLNQMNETLKTANQTNQHEETMSGKMNKQGYFQGTEEPTPGQAKYEKDPLNENLREHEDKQMVGQKPFTGVGAVDGLHPSPDSVGGDELARKKMLARAESEERAIRREALVSKAKEALESKGYWQGGGGANEPTPGKTKYAPEKLNEDVREKEDKQMVGQKPFPGVGSVDGLHPSPSSADVADEKKRKELLQRASYKARFVKAANNDGTLNLGKSAWEVFYGDKLLLTASVDDLSAGRADVLGDTIATKDFGLKLIEKVKVQGAEKFASMIKSAQEMPPVVDAAPPVPATPEGDMGGNGDPKEGVDKLADQVRDLASDLAESVHQLTGEQAEMGEMAPEMGQKAASIHKARKEINTSLQSAMKEVIASLNESEKELTQLASLDPAVVEGNKDLVEAVYDGAVKDAKTSIAEGTKLLSHFVKYARGTKALLKQAEIETELEKMAADEGDDMDANDKEDDKEDKDENNADDLMNLVNETSADIGAVEDMMNADSEDDENDLDDATKKKLMDQLDEAAKKEVEKTKAPTNPFVPPTTQKAEDGLSTEASFDTKEGRAAMRMKLAAETLKYNPILHDAHPKGGFTTQLDVKPTGDLAKVEDLEEVQDAMLDLAKAPSKVRKEAEVIHRLISEGKLQVSELDDLVAQGLDSAAVSYYKKYWGEVEGGSEFASELVKEHAKAEMESTMNTFKVKMGRAYELAYDMAERGIIHNDRVSVSNQVDEVMKLDDEAFETIKRVVARQVPSMQKKASRMPQVGIIEESNVREMSLTDELTMALMSGNKRRMF